MRQLGTDLEWIQSISASCVSSCNHRVTLSCSDQSSVGFIPSAAGLRVLNSAENIPLWLWQCASVLLSCYWRLRCSKHFHAGLTYKSKVTEPVYQWLGLVSLQIWSRLYWTVWSPSHELFSIILTASTVYLMTEICVTPLFKLLWLYYKVR